MTDHPGRVEAWKVKGRPVTETRTASGKTGVNNTCLSGMRSVSWRTCPDDPSEHNKVAMGRIYQPSPSSCVGPVPSVMKLAPPSPSVFHLSTRHLFI